MERYKLRDYQKEAVEETLDFLKSARDLEERPLNPLVVVPTGGGKSIIIAEITRRFAACNWRVLIVQHRKELIEQNAEKIRSLLDPKFHIGVYSAGLNQKDVGHHVTVAGIQSIFRRPEKLGKIDLVIVDESHLIPPTGEGMYLTLISKLRETNPRCMFIGLTATPFRMTSGPLTSDDGIFDAIAYNCDIHRLVEEGYLSPIISKSSLLSPDTSSIKKRGDFIMSEAEKVFSADPIISGAVREIVHLASDRKSILVFCTGIKHCELVSDALAKAGVGNELVTGETMFREDIIARFKAGKLRCIVNCEVLTTGFDAPNVDCVVILRPTQSAGLFCQMVGRGLRIAQGKKDCLLLDYGGNLLRHGPIDQISLKPRFSREKGVVVDELITMPQKLCPGCGDMVSLKSLKCKLCGYEFELEVKHETVASDLPALSYNEPVIYEIDRVVFSRHQKKDKPDSLKIEYHNGIERVAAEWLCLEHKGYTREKGQKEWAWFCQERAESVEQALFFAHIGAVRVPQFIRCKRDENSFLKITGRKAGEKKIEIDVLGFHDPAHSEESEKGDIIDEFNFI